MGIDTHKPSGMLWIAMAMAKDAPTAGSSRVATNVARPSGKLWIPMANAVIMPMSARRGSLVDAPFVDSSTSRGARAASASPAASAGIGAPAPRGGEFLRRAISSQTASSISWQCTCAFGGASSAMYFAGSDAACAARFGSRRCTSTSSAAMKSMPANSAPVAAMYASLSPMADDAMKPSWDLTRISTNDTYSMTPADRPNAPARNFLDASCTRRSEKTTAAPRPVALPAAATKTSPSSARERVMVPQTKLVSLR
mmetsp:Transcript_29552/g.91369  ORF Transcript_29552/g.91369 Transcript_29552/m.91369 type:complete len:255 (+) Transcript_29552:405-1169(+)